ncbi:MAG: urease accessory protein [Natronomonas sp.]|jgi:urease accessory protein
MERIDGVVGNRHSDPDLGERIDSHERAGTLEVVRIEAGDRKRSRLRAETDEGTDLGIVLDRPLTAGDVLTLDDERAIVVEFERRDAAVVDLPEPTTAGVKVAVELGHRIGNQHWGLAVEDGSLYVPVEADRHILEGVLAEQLPEGATVEYEEVDPAVWLDGETPDADHEHSHGAGGHEHSHDNGHGTSHDHAGSDSHVDYRDATDRGERQ